MQFFLFQYYSVTRYNIFNGETMQDVTEKEFDELSRGWDSSDWRDR